MAQTFNQASQNLAAQQKPPAASESEWASVDETITLVSACLALVRPIGMSDSAAAEWLSVAATDLSGYRANLLKAACAEARKTCTHHGQIVPTVIKEMEEMTPFRMGKPLARKPVPTLAPPPPEIQGLIEGVSKSLTAQ